MKKLALHWQILLGMVVGIIFGFIAIQFGWKNFVSNWINPFGTIFVKLLKLIAVPLIIASLIKGISDLKDISKFRNIGVRTIFLYIATTIVAITIGLLLVNIVQPGKGISEETISKLTNTYANSSSVQGKIIEASKQKSSGPLQFLVDMVPDNAIKAMGNNASMLQVIFFTIFFGISMLLIGEKRAKPLKKFFDSLNEVVLKMVDLIMLFAPYAVFALLANVVVSSNDPDLLVALLKYSLTVVFGLLLMIVFYMVLISIFTKKNPLWFLKQLSPAQLLAFSTSSSAATLPVTMERVEEHIGVDKEVSSFVLPVGATINMDGTSLYQAVAAVFIAQALGFDLTFTNQLFIILTALLASIGSAAVPGAGMVMLVIVLESISFPADKLAIGLALIFAVDRPLDMCRTVVNVTGDATVSTLVAKSIGKLRKPKPKNWDDNYDSVK
ncbi:dicarboxylate/amino acid:cation symporter [Tenacibaculum sp. UWU-22]|uniref:dicarboxylate/amino acid:cation symporter n=1 Tax=Tenacibaculum sp. UWU-22 TaxID=3234187 RepID=UPI0034DAF060